MPCFFLRKSLNTFYCLSSESSYDSCDFILFAVIRSSLLLPCAVCALFLFFSPNFTCHPSNLTARMYTLSFVWRLRSNFTAKMCTWYSVCRLPSIFAAWMCSLFTVCHHLFKFIAGMYSCPQFGVIRQTTNMEPRHSIRWKKARKKLSILWNLRRK